MEGIYFFEKKVAWNEVKIHNGEKKEWTEYGWMQWSFKTKREEKKTWRRQRSGKKKHVSQWYTHPIHACMQGQPTLPSKKRKKEKKKREGGVFQLLYLSIFLSFGFFNFFNGRVHR
ncbi:hypothetical protein I7I53_08472 [Histoplasma capsulatum var. duboisii H88]|uniref:Uncharacterized protein n=1 Tax=Ajellomyces capsulatus (strain H88) TaxID=544711 RepID=A0A8A1LJD2_AJEC8|nr:hypothetical protein I7I53_08472 [Histoplasma capsulatum var. duboisii H88]